MSDFSLLLESPPRNWTPVSFGDISDRVQDVASPSTDGDRLYLGLEHLASGPPALVGRGTESDVRSGKTSFRSGDVLFGKLRPYLRKSVLVCEDGICSTDILVFRATKKCIPEFICLLTHTDEFVGHAKATTSGVQHPRTSWSGLREFQFHLPPISEQRTIAAVLGLVQQALEQQERLIALTTDLKKTLLNQLFTKGLRGEPQKQTEIGPVPQSWEMVRLGTIAKIGNGSTPKRDNDQYWHGGTIPWLNSTKIHERFITEADQFVTDFAVKECHLPHVKPGSLLIAITGQGKTLGNSALVSFETCINQHLAYAEFTTSRVIPEFVLWFMQTRYDHLRSISQAGGSTKGALTCGYLKTYPIPIPTLDEQRNITDVFAALDRKEKVHQRRHASLTDLFRTLLHQLMTAQIRVQNLDLAELETAVKE
jgi:type I restriction enzyme S subunit